MEVLEAVLRSVSEPTGKAKAMHTRIPKVDAEVVLVTNDVVITTQEDVNPREQSDNREERVLLAINTRNCNDLCFPGRNSLTNWIEEPMISTSKGASLIISGSSWEPSWKTILVSPVLHIT